VSNEVPFPGFEPIPKTSTIVVALHLETSELKAKLTIKGGLQCLLTHFLFQKASLFTKLDNNEAFHSVLALLIYGQFCWYQCHQNLPHQKPRPYITCWHLPFHPWSNHSWSWNYSLLCTLTLQMVYLSSTTNSTLHEKSWKASMVPKNHVPYPNRHSLVHRIQWYQNCHYPLWWLP